MLRYMYTLPVAPRLLVAHLGYLLISGLTRIYLSIDLKCAIPEYDSSPISSVVGMHGIHGVTTFAHSSRALVWGGFLGCCTVSDSGMSNETTLK